ncbi:MAG TPA: hypothetical protein VLT79_00565, partial [Gemmatimonadales bacterium]|nr:hypothetical protein [Gemmatimonadales bacterium]
MANRATDGVQNADASTSSELPPPRLLVIPDDATSDFPAASAGTAPRVFRAKAAGKVVGGTLLAGALLGAGFYGYPLLRGST